MGEKSRPLVLEWSGSSGLSPQSIAVHHCIRGLSRELEKDYPWSCCTQMTGFGGRNRGVADGKAS